MIRREESGTTWVIHQAAHAVIAGQIAEHWTGTQNMTLAPRDALLIAAGNHDAGWIANEHTPRINAKGQPRTFTEMGLNEHFAIWEHSIQSVFAQNRYAGLLTSMHCTALYEQRLRFVADPPGDRAQIEAFLARWHAWQDALINALKNHPLYALAVGPQPLADNLRLLQVWDYLSLVLCMSPVHEQALDDVPLGNGARGDIDIAGNGERGMTLDPFPLDQPLRLWIDARQVIGGPFESDEALQFAMKDVPYKPLAFEITPL